jgi:DNA topoisomerase VI subunit A
VYYQGPALFGQQPVSDEIVHRLAKSLGTSRLSLNVIAATKGESPNFLDNGDVIEPQDADEA